MYREGHGEITKKVLKGQEKKGVTYRTSPQEQSMVVPDTPRLVICYCVVIKGSSGGQTPH